MSAALYWSPFSSKRRCRNIFCVAHLMVLVLVVVVVVRVQITVPAVAVEANSTPLCTAQTVHKAAAAVGNAPVAAQAAPTADCPGAVQ